MSHKHTPRRLSGLLATRLHRHPLFWGCSINCSICVGFAPSKCYWKCCSVWVCTCVWRWLISCDVYSFKKCNTATTGVLWSMEIITMSVFAWQPKTSYYNRFIKSPLGTDILIWLFQAFDWGTGGRKAVTLWWFSHFVCHFVKEREKRASWIKVVLLQQTWAAQLAVRDISTWINGHNSNPKIYVTYYIIYNILVNIFIIEFNERKRLKLCMSPSAGHFTVLTFHISWSTVQILHIIVYIYHLCVIHWKLLWNNFHSEIACKLKK